MKHLIKFMVGILYFSLKYILIAVFSLYIGYLFLSTVYTAGYGFPFFAVVVVLSIALVVGSYNILEYCFERLEDLFDY